MYGFQDLAFQQQQRFWVYTGNKNNTGFQTWLKPPGISFIHIITIGPGAGGSGTVAYQAGTAWRGGSGGGGGSMNSVFLPAYLVPDTIYINVGLGGTGGASSTTATPNAGTAGQDLTYVTFHPVKTVAYAFCIASPGGAGSLPAGGTGAIGGNGGATAGSTFFPVSQIGLRNYIGGQAGATGGQNGAANNITATYRITGGGGGSGNTVGGVTGVGSSIAVVGGNTSINTIAPSPAGTDGSQFIDLINFIFGGGTGASSSTAISGSNGGFGGYGCGGGGGSVGPGLGGGGGKGGDGLVIITCG